METVYLGLGSNLGDRAENLRLARHEIAKISALKKHSTIFETHPFDVELPQPDFLNQVVEISTDLDAVQLLLTLQEIERELGRGPHRSGGPRVIDIDILIYGDAEIVTVAPDWTLLVPHPRMNERAFVLVPLLEIAPHLRHPVLGTPFTEIVANLDRSGVKPWYDEPGDICSPDRPNPSDQSGQEPSGGLR